MSDWCISYPLGIGEVRKGPHGAQGLCPFLHDTAKVSGEFLGNSLENLPSTRDSRSPQGVHRAKSVHIAWVHLPSTRDRRSAPGVHRKLAAGSTGDLFYSSRLCQLLW